MTTIKKSIVIKGDPMEIDALTSDTGRLPEWYAGVVEAEAESGYPERIGSQAKLSYKAAGVTFETTLTTVEFEAGKQSLFQMDGMITGTNRWTYATEEEGTRITLEFDYEMPGGGLGKIADRLLVERMNDKNAQTSLKNLKALFEGG
ncbi:MAG TPA: SRPBCC family protein [Anaerolineae bacterium]|nr:SRPBCC family protein [Anaerolineae bacterium]